MKFSSSSIIFLIAVSHFLLHGAEAQTHLNKKSTSNKAKNGKKKKKSKRDNNTNTIGLALEGGAMPAGIVMGGIMRGFQQKKTSDGNPSIDKIKYIAGVSGANFPLLVYTYAKGTTSSLLLDVDGISDPSEITVEELENIPETSVFKRFTIPYDGYILLALMKGIYFGEDDPINIFTRFVYSVMLEPFGIGIKDGPSQHQREDAKPTPLVMTSMFGPKEVYPETLALFGQQFLKDLKAAAAGSLLEMTHPNDFKVVPDTDFLWKLAERSGFQIPVGAYMSPDELSIPMTNYTMKIDPIIDPSDNSTKTTEPINFDSVLSSLNDLQPESEGPFTIAKMLGMGTNLLPFIGPNPVDKPAIMNIPTSDGNGPRNMTFVDGGFNEWNGVPALVHKKVRNIISVHYATADQLQKDEHGHFSELPLMEARGKFAFLFGATNFELLTGYPQERAARALNEIAPTRHVFDLHSNGENQFLKWINNMNSLYAAGEPLITTLKNVDVVENKFWGIEGGYKVDLTTIIMIGVPKKFSEKVSPDVAPPPEGQNFTSPVGNFNNEDLKYVPNLIHRNENIISIPELDIDDLMIPIPEFSIDTKPAKMSQILSSWTVTHSWDGLVGDDGQKKFDGFAEIFESL